MATRTEREALKVTICGPNLYDQTRGTFHVHAADCSDLQRHARREPEYLNGWTVEVRSREGIVREIYSDHMAENDDTDWRGYDDLYVFPCLAGLPDEEG